MTTHTIEIEGLPEGWEAVAYRKPSLGEMYYDDGKLWKCSSENFYERLIVQKTKPRRIVLEETGEDISMDRQQILVDDEDNYLVIRGAKIWREVKEE